MKSDSIQILTHDEVLDFQNMLIERFGGQASIRDSWFLLSALYRAQTGYYEDLAEKGTTLFGSLIINHLFVDEKKKAFCEIRNWSSIHNRFHVSKSTKQKRDSIEQYRNNPLNQ